MKILIAVGLSVLLSGEVISKSFRVDLPSCHSSLGELSLDFMSTKRPYFYNSSTAHNYDLPGCTPVKFWYFGRHGTRNPGTGDISAMQEILSKVHDDVIESLGTKDHLGSLCADAASLLESWEVREDLNPGEASFLAEQGRQELLSIATRFKSRFPSLFSLPFDNDTYLFRHTDFERTEESARAFTEGIFEPEDINDVWFPPPLPEDPLLKFFKICPKWTEEVDHNSKTYKEHDEFLSSTHMTSTIQKVSSRLGLPRNVTLGELTIIYTTCAFETAWEGGVISPWCAVFDKEDFQVMAYREDLEYYWKEGYPSEINYKQACPPFKDLIDYFDKHVRNPSDPLKVQGYFSHSGATLKMLARLGLFNDSFPITAANFPATKNAYRYRTSLIDHMATNFAFTLYSCPESPLKHRVGFFFQEVPTPFPGCGGSAFCSYEKFKAHMASFVDSCDLEEICYSESFAKLRKAGVVVTQNELRADHDSLKVQENPEIPENKYSTAPPQKI